MRLLSFFYRVMRRRKQKRAKSNLENTPGNRTLDPTDIDPRGEVWYCKDCGEYAGQTPGAPSVGKTLVLITCDACQRNNLLERSEHV